MEVKDLIKEDLTEEQLVLLEADEKKAKFKILKMYIGSKGYKKTIKHFITKGNKLLKDIREEVQLRRDINSKTVATKTELDKSIVFYDFQNEMIKNMGDSEAEKILKEDLEINADNTDTHIVNKIEEMYDVPVYTKLDILKQKRIDCITVEERLQRMVGFYQENINTMSNPNPYEEENEEFKAQTDVN